MTLKKASNWKTFIEGVLVSKNGFKVVSHEIKGEIQEVTYRCQKPNSKTSFIVSYFLRTNDMVAFRFYNPITRGYNEFSKNAYFYSLQFTKRTSIGNPGIDYTETNKAGFLSVLKKGIHGRETQYLKDQIIVKSELSIVEGENTFNYQYRFTRSPMIDILINKTTNSDASLDEKTIDLQTIFSSLIVD